MAPQPVAAVFRLTWRYTVDSFVHALRVYCECVASADPSGNDVIHKAGTANAGVSTLDTAVYTAMAPFFNPAHDSFTSMTLEQRIVPTQAWQFVYAKTTAVVPTGAGPVNPAMGLCLSGKDNLNRELPVYIFEGGFGVTHKDTSYAALNAANKLLIDTFFNVGGGATAAMPWSYRTSKDDTAHPGRWLAVVVDSNQKLRRARRIT